MIKQLRCSPLQSETATANEFVFTVCGNYDPVNSPVIKGPLTQTMLSVKLKVGASKPLVLALDTAPTGLGALSMRIAQSLGITIRLSPLTSKQCQDANLVLAVKMVPATNLSETIKDRLEQEFEESLEPWTDNEYRHNIRVRISQIELLKHYDLNKPDMVENTPQSTNRLGYQTFDKIDVFREQESREIPPTVNRDLIPQSGPGVVPDPTMAGGLQWC